MVLSMVVAKLHINLLLTVSVILHEKIRYFFMNSDSMIIRTYNININNIVFLSSEAELYQNLF